MILIIENESDYIKTLKKNLEANKIKYISIKAGKRINIEKLKNVRGIILSGGSLEADSKEAVTDYVAISSFDVPILGFCLGHEIIALAFGGKLRKLPKRQYKPQEIILDSDDALFKGLGKKIYLVEKHYYEVSKIPNDFKPLAHSSACKYEIIRHKKKEIYGFQSHPEVSGDTGKMIINNFLGICRVKGRLK